jgi:hypothetical protein
VRLTLRPSAYASCALLASSLAAGISPGDRVALLELLALWALADLALGAYLGGMVAVCRALPWAASRQRPSVEAPATLALGGGLAIMIASWFGHDVGYLTASALALGALVALSGVRRSPHEAMAALTGLQVSIAWALGLARTGPWLQPLLLLGVAAGLGSWLRLRYGTAGGRATLWSTRLLWMAWGGLLLATRQPLLAGLVALTALADDLHRLGPRRPAAAAALLDAGWLGTWLLVALAASYWGIAT